jgi:hypothetical protein
VKGRPVGGKDLIYDVVSNPKDRMIYCAIFYERWKITKRVPQLKGFNKQIWDEFRKYFNKVYETCKRENRKMTERDFNELRWEHLLKRKSDIITI